MSVYKADRTRQYIYIALLCAQGVIIGLLERMIPFPFAFAPGAKLGLANLITIISLFTMSIPRQLYSDVLATAAHHTTWRHLVNLSLQWCWCGFIVVWHVTH